MVQQSNITPLQNKLPLTFNFEPVEDSIIVFNQEVKKSLSSLNSRLSYALENVPARLPKKQEQGYSPQGDHKNQPESQKENVAPGKPLPKSGAQPLPVSRKPAVCVQQVELLTVDEFNAVPKYMRGRLTYDQVNNTVEELNRAYVAKYKLLGQKRNKLSDQNRKKWEKFKSQENKDSTGYYFIVDEDVKAYTGLKVDNTFRNIITVLRHSGRMKEIRGGGITRYAVLFVY